MEPNDERVKPSEGRDQPNEGRDNRNQARDVKPKTALEEEWEQLTKARDQMYADGNPFAKRVDAMLNKLRADYEDEERVRSARVKRRDRSRQPASSNTATLDSDLSAEGESWAYRARSLVRRAGHKRGAARETLIRLFAARDCAVSVAELEETLEMTGQPVGRASIYRALEVMTDLDLLVRVDVGDGVSRYERAHDHDDAHHHHHMICDTCGVLFPFDDEELELAIYSVNERHGFDAKGHEVTLHGTCQECRDGAPE
jgi:Fur family transcriptional regulator, ferric uptake regulator